MRSLLLSLFLVSNLAQAGVQCSDAAGELLYVKQWFISGVVPPPEAVTEKDSLHFQGTLIGTQTHYSEIPSKLWDFDMKNLGTTQLAQWEDPYNYYRLYSTKTQITHKNGGPIYPGMIEEEELTRYLLCKRTESKFVPPLSH